MKADDEGGGDGKGAGGRAAAKRRYSIQVLDRIMRILGCFTSTTPELRLVDIEARLRMHRSSVFRILEAMRGHGLVEIEPETGKYHLGLRLFELGSLAVGRLELTRAAMPTLEWLTRTTGETAHLCVLDGGEVVYIAKVESEHALRIPSGVGRRNPAYCTGVGKALLAHLAPEELESYLRRTQFRRLTKQTIVSAGPLEAELRTARARGFAVDDCEVHDGVRCVAAPIRDHAGAVIASVSISGPTVRLTKARLAEHTQHVKKAAQVISTRLGYNAAAAAAAAAVAEASVAD